ncbi:hypothetical protein [Actinophytocola sp.]|uniref:hypothetical protein n=1 Tax=Actinophytocola sp. TaxID=1872138 RepID=UPI002D7EADE6|nr:hypothetical protein [Actinophytocola sp.]HET9138691.1 hypothetical protein [Actinophytocola sp.]
MSQGIEWETLQRLMPPRTGSDAVVDWARLSESWGRQFPADYRRFLDAYGTGEIQAYLSIVTPEPRDRPLSESLGMAAETVNAEYAWAEEDKSPALVDTDPELIAWGVDASADLLCWDAFGADPDTWPVLVFNRGDARWRRYDCGMVEFLIRLLRADFDTCPLGGTDLWGIGSAVFLTPTERNRLRNEGLDPWTGKPDPLTGTFVG